jgi:hypothetical protein
VKPEESESTAYLEPRSGFNFILNINRIFTGIIYQDKSRFSFTLIQTNSLELDYLKAGLYLSVFGLYLRVDNFALLVEPLLETLNPFAAYHNFKFIRYELYNHPPVEIAGYVVDSIYVDNGITVYLKKLSRIKHLA